MSKLLPPDFEERTTLSAKHPLWRAEGISAVPPERKRRPPNTSIGLWPETCFTLHHAGPFPLCIRHNPC